NRMLIIDMLLKKAHTGELELLQAAKEIREELNPNSGTAGAETSTKPGLETLESLKKATLLILEAAAQSLGKKLKEEQEVLMHISDMMIQLYVLEAVLTKGENLSSNGKDSKSTHITDISNVFLYESVEKI